jgi:hypothetical protein
MLLSTLDCQDDKHMGDNMRNIYNNSCGYQPNLFYALLLAFFIPLVSALLLLRKHLALESESVGTLSSSSSLLSPVATKKSQ